MKNGITAPKMVSVDNFVTAIPSSLFDEIVSASNATIMPCKVPPADSNKMVIGERAVSLKTGNRMIVARNAITEGMPNRANMSLVFLKGIMNK